MENLSSIDPLEMVRMVATARIIMPKSRIRLSAGRQQLGREVRYYVYNLELILFLWRYTFDNWQSEVEADRKLLADAGIKANFSCE